MINVTQIDRAYDEDPEHQIKARVRKQIEASPLLAVGAAFGAGFLAWSLLKPRATKTPQLPRRVIQELAGLGVGRRVNRDFKAVIGSLALNFMSRKLKKKLHLR